MRLRRLDLIRYGKFTDKTIDFGPKPEVGPDLHIVFGLNEAGKSTALSAYLDLLFGIEERSRYNFLHEYSAMRVGGVLELAGSEHAFTRTKQRNNSLLNATGQPVSEVAITAHLAGLLRDAYTTMFSLDDETLEAGGKSILESRGDLGKLLFMASAGLGHASDTLSALEVEADGLYRKQAHGTELALLKKRLADLKSRKDAVDTLASTYEGLETERLDAELQHDRIISDRAVLAARLDAISRFERARPLLADLRRKIARLDELPDMISPARTWTGSITDLIEDDASLRTRLSANIDKSQRLAGKIASVDVDDVILNMSERVRGLAESKVRYASAGLDLPNRKIELQILDNAVANCLAALGRSSEPDPFALLLPAATVGIVRTMVEQRSGITIAVRGARDEAAAALDALQMARQRVGEERAVPAPVRARLGAALSKARASAHGLDIRPPREARDAGTIRLQAGLARLKPWSGDARTLAAVAVPSAGEISAWKTAASELAKTSAVVAERLAEYHRNHALLAARLDALRASVDIADDEEANTIRRARDEAWATHRAALTGDTADEFALILERDDTAGAGRLSKASDLADIRAMARALAEATADLSRMRQQRVQTDKDVDLQVLEIRTVAGDLLGDTVDASLARLIERVEDRIAARSDALAAWEQIELAAKKAERAAETEEQLCQELHRALTSVGITPATGDGLEAIMAIAELFLERQRKLDAEHAEALRTVASKEDDLAARRLALASTERREEEWLAGIGDALKGTWLANGLAAPAVGTVLDQLAELSKSLQERQRSSIAHRQNGGRQGQFPARGQRRCDRGERAREE